MQLQSQHNVQTHWLLIKGVTQAGTEGTITATSRPEITTKIQTAQKLVNMPCGLLLHRLALLTNGPPCLQMAIAPPCSLHHCCPADKLAVRAAGALAQAQL